MEIHGLRGLAIALVVVYHLWGVGRVSGGVDIFLMISAYLMTLSFLRQGEEFDTGAFLVKRFRQLLPQAALVIVSTVLASLWLMPASRLPVIIDQAKASLLYYQNWVLIGLATDYNSPDRSGTSPLQHFWSLSMQGQVFLAWGLIMGLAVLLARQLKVSIRLTLLVVFGILAVSSLTVAVRQVQINPIGAYFNTFARVWEFALPSLLALVPTFRFRRSVVRLLGWGGLAAVLSCGIIVGHEPFPGPAALVPSLGAAAIVLAGSGGDRSTVAYWLASAPLKFLGDRAYGLYLWHWPIYMIWLTRSGERSIGLGEGLAVIALAIICADLATRIVERRFNQWGLLRSWQAGLATLVTIGVATYAILMIANRPVTLPTATVGLDPNGGADRATPGVRVSGEPTRNVAPGDTKIAQDWPDQPLCSPTAPPAPALSLCSEFPAPRGTPTKTVIVVGDSHSRHWVPLLQAIAQDKNWQVLTYSRSSCRVATPGPLVDQACAEYSRAVVQTVVRMRPDFVFAVGTRAPLTPNDREEHVEGMSEVMRPVLDAGIPVIAMRDNPRWSFKMPECVQQFGNDVGRCSRPVSEKLAPVSPLNALDPRFVQMDMTESLCPGGICNGVIGGAYVYMDDSHLSKTFVVTLRKEFEAQLFAVIPR